MESSSEVGAAFYELPPDAFPFTLQYLRADTCQVIYAQRVTGPGCLKIPPLGPRYGVPIAARIITADGAVVSEYWPEGT